MIDNTTLNQIIAIHQAARPTVMEYAGAGSQALWWLHSVAGSSRTILEASDPLFTTLNAWFDWATTGSICQPSHRCRYCRMPATGVPWT
jgi:hypothetical protein